MRSLPKVEFTLRARRDIRDLIGFISRQPWGKPDDRRADLDAAIKQICHSPKARPIRRIIKASGIGLRCRFAGQFAIIYAILAKRAARSGMAVSIRAVRHWRVRDVFRGVREGTGAAPPLSTRDDTADVECAEWREGYQM